MGGRIYKINHQYSDHPSNRDLTKGSLLKSLLKPSYRQQADVLLTHWRQLQEHANHSCQPTIDFDQIMEQDLERELQELERQEQEDVKSHLQRDQACIPSHDASTNERLKKDAKVQQQRQGQGSYQRRQVSGHQMKNQQHLLHMQQQLHHAELLKKKLAVAMENQTKTKQIISLLESHSKKCKHMLDQLPDNKQIRPR